MKIVSVDNVCIYPEHEKMLQKLGEVVIYHNTPSEEEGINRIIDADIVIDNWFKMPASVIKASTKLKLIAVAATGYDWIDLEESKKRGITICNAPGYSTEAVAEHTIGLMLHAIRHATSAETSYRSGTWDTTLFKGKELSKKTLGIIGYGAIGRRVAQIAENGFGMNTMFVNSKSSRADLESLLKNSDIISINSPLTDTTRDLISTIEFDLMKPGVVIVNTGRGAVINQDALQKNLASGKIFAAGLDVLENEPVAHTNPIFTFPNVVLTPHIGWNTKEAEYNLSKLIISNIQMYIHGTPQNKII